MQPLRRKPGNEGEDAARPSPQDGSVDTNHLQRLLFVHNMYLLAAALLKSLSRDIVTATSQWAG
jgi:hypothetical protein